MLAGLRKIVQQMQTSLVRNPVLNWAQVRNPVLLTRC